MKGEIDPSQFVHVTEGFGFRRSIEAETVSDLAERLELGVCCDASGEQTESEKLITLFDKSKIQGSRSDVEKYLSQLNTILTAPPEYSSSAQKAAELEQQRLKKERQLKKRAKQVEMETKNKLNKFKTGKRQVALSGALALQAKLQADPVAMEKFLKEVDEAKQREQEKHKEYVRKEKIKYREKMKQTQGADEDITMPLRLQNIVNVNIKSVNRGMLSKEATLNKTRINSLKLVKRQTKARETRELEEEKLQRRADEMKIQMDSMKVRAINTPVRKQFELAASLFLTSTIWRCANVCIDEHKGRMQRDLEYRAIFILQRHFREALRILHLRQKNHALIIIRNAMIDRLLLRRYRDKEQASEKIKLISEDIEMRRKILSASKVFFKKILVVQRFVKRLYISSISQKQMIVSQLLDAEGDIINEIVCSDLYAKAKIKYAKDLKEWKDLRKISRSKADKMGAPVLVKPERQTEEVIRPLRMNIENIQNAAEIVFKQRIKLKSWDDHVRLFYISPESATKIVQSIRTAIQSGGEPNMKVLAEMAK